jgi:hypothetical protein
MLSEAELKRARRLYSDLEAAKRNCRFEQISALLECLGYQGKQPRRGGSHYVFRMKNCPPITVPKARPVGVRYVQQVLARAAELLEQQLGTGWRDTE